MTKIIIFTATVLALLSACKKDVKIDLPENERKLVVNGVFAVGEPVSLLVSKSKSMLENTEVESVDYAIIKLYENSNYLATLDPIKQFWYTKSTKVETTYKIDTFYRSRYISKGLLVLPDKTYKIEVSAAGIDKIATVEFKVPKLVPILKIDTLTAKTSGNVRDREFDVFINDPLNEENFYVLQLKIRSKSSYQDKSGKTIVQESFYYQSIESGDVIFSSGNFSINTGLFFNDQLFDGKQKSIRFKTREFLNKIPYYNYYEANKKYMFILKSISKDYHNYLVSINLYNNANENPIAEPAGVKSNVKNGLGIVTAVNQWIDSSIVIKRP